MLPCRSASAARPNARLLALLLSLIAVVVPARAEAQRLLKGNLASTLVGVPQVGIEWRTAPRRSFQLDLTVSPWQSVRGKPFQFAILVPEWRWHRDTTQLGWYVGAHAGAMVFHMQKPFYWGTDYFQDGFGAVLGGSVGYQWRLRGDWVLDAYLGGGTAQSLYKGTFWSTGERYDTLSLPGWDRSGEWLVYRGGVMLGRRR